MTQTAVEWLFQKLWDEPKDKLTWYAIREKAIQMEKEQIFEDLIGLQIYLNNKGLITNHDWDFEKMAKLYLKKEYGK